MLTDLQGWDVPRVQPSKNVPAEGGDDAGDVWGLWFSLGHAEGRKREENLVLVTASCLDSAPGACRGIRRGLFIFPVRKVHEASVSDDVSSLKEGQVSQEAFKGAARACREKLGRPKL